MRLTGLTDDYEQLINEAKQYLKAQEEVRRLALDGHIENLAQVSIFAAIDGHVYSFQGVSRQLEAVRNIA